MSDRQKQTWSGYILMFGVFTLVFSTIVPSIVKTAVDNVTAVPVIISRLDRIDALQETILEHQVTFSIDLTYFKGKSDRCVDDIKELKALQVEKGYNAN